MCYTPAVQELPPVLQGNPEEIIQGYPWPSSKLTKADMIRLTELRERLQKPITKLLHEAVEAYYHVLLNGAAIIEEQSHDCCWNLKDVPSKALLAELQRREK